MISIFAAEGPNGAFLPADIKEFWWSAAAFGIVLFALITKVLPLVRKGMSSRSDGIRDELVEAERARVEAEAELSSLRTRLGDADAEAEKILAEARDNAATVKSDLISRADADAVDAKAKAEAEVSASTGQASADIQAAVAGQAAAATESVVNSNLDAGTHADLIDRYIQEVSSS